MAAALAVVSCSSGTHSAGTTQEKPFDVTGFGKLKPGMSKQEALATGELAATGAGKTGTCEDFRYQGAPAPDPKQLAEDEAVEQQYQAAQKAADEAEAAAGPAPGPNAGAAAIAHAAKLAASAEAASKVAQLAADSTSRAAKRAEALNTHGGVRFAGDRIRIIVPPQGAQTTKKIGKDATVEQFKAAHPEAKEVDAKTYDVAVPDQPGYVLSFRFTDGKLGSFLLFTHDLECE
ncbi:hypothetical protein BBK82_10585 [Lentzea guizhouensis]|uniref:Uncharacterized protein n=1 Tax=Lentzea guizhouensis TaxID=1586287 RepID=A0A1B2HFF7_9PSEU|nr:hypothetical protein [Lentzea guizhouensis]ANZ36443.1 hypothetical protein BBK82_10585 [Lentzea guizhouensis]